MNKRIILIIAVLLVAAGSVFQKSAFPEQQKELSAPKSQEQISKDSPFGASFAFSRPFFTDDMSPQEVYQILSRLEEPYKHVQDVGIKWIRSSDIYWDMVQPTQDHIKNNRYEWSLYDNLYGRVPPEINILGTIICRYGFRPGTWQFVNKEIEDKYIEFVKKVVKRYGANEKDNMPGLKNRITYWQVGNEEAVSPDFDWKGFSHILQITYQTIKDIDPDAKILLGGLAAGERINQNDPVFRQQLENFYFPILSNFQGKYFDIFDIHYYGPSGYQQGEIQMGWRGMKNIYDVIRQALDKSGYKNTEIWFTETAGASTFSERLQAADLVKRFIYPLSLGANKIFWWSMLEGEPPLEVDRPTNHLGLVYDGIGKDDLGYGVKKLAYYTYKKMVEILEGSDWNDIQRVQESDGIYLYRFMRHGKPVWMAWNDNEDPRRVRIRLEKDTQNVKITEAVPKYESGKEVADYKSAFREVIRRDFLESYPPQLVVEIGSIPVFMEEN